MNDPGKHWDALRVIAAAAATAAPLVLLARDPHWSDQLIRSSELVANALVLGAAVFVYFHWRTTSSTPGRASETRLAGWLTVALTIAGMHGLVQSSLRGVGPGDTSPLVGEIVVLVVFIVLAYVAERAQVPCDPALAGTIGGLGVAAITTLELSVAPTFAVSTMTGQLVSASVMAAGLLLAWTLLHRATVPMWARRRLATSAVLLTTGHCMGYLAAQHGAVISVGVLANLGGAVVLCSMTQVLLRRSALEHQRELQLLKDTLAQAQANMLEDRELLHEVGSTVAGITAAARVMRQGPRLSRQRRARLERMLDAELARLDRLMSSRAPAAAHEFEVDDVVELLVTSHQERGLDIHWSQSHVRAVGDPDDLAEVVNILLDNARRHGGTTVWVDVSADDEYVEVACRDNGPGVADEVQPRLFSSGARGPGSLGQGLGLSIAQRLMSERGGSLELAGSRTSGATFVARLPVSEMTHAPSHYVA